MRVLLSMPTRASCPVQAFDAATAAGSAPTMWLAAPYSGTAPTLWVRPSLARAALQRLLACARRSVDALQVLIE
jgi:hypothetical protein